MAVCLRSLAVFQLGSALLGLGLVGCTADGASPGPAGSVGGSGGPGGPGTGGSPGTVVPTPEACKTAPVARTPLRRLTRFEYQNSVRDLLGVDPGAAQALPADEVTGSFDNNAAVLTVSSLHAEKYVLVSEALAKEAVKNLAALTACQPGASEEACATSFAQKLGRRAFRRPTTPADEQLLMAAYASGKNGGSHAEGIEVMIRAALQSPNFLYRLETTAPPADAQARAPLSAFELATRLSYLVWASGPDDALLDAAAQGQLATKEQVAAKAREMLARPQARTALASFFEQWSGATRLDVITKNTTLFPSYSTELRDAMARELPAFVEHVLWSGDRSLRALLTEPVAFVSGPLAQLYGVSAPASATPTLVNLPDAQGRSGLLTQAGFLSVQGHPDQTSPVLRGKFVRAMLLCQPPSPPPPDVDISLPTVDQGATARERMSAHLSAGNSCNGCHSLMDPIGLAFEHFDAMGQYRDADNGHAIDVSGELTSTTDPSLAGAFNGVRELGEKLAQSAQVRDCVATQWFRFASGRTEADADACSLSQLKTSFAPAGDVLELVVASTQTDAFWYRSAL